MRKFSKKEAPKPSIVWCIVLSSIVTATGEDFGYCSKRRLGFRVRRSPAFEDTKVRTSCAVAVALEAKKKTARAKAIVPLFLALVFSLCILDLFVQRSILSQGSAIQPNNKENARLSNLQTAIDNIAMSGADAN